MIKKSVKKWIQPQLFIPSESVCNLKLEKEKQKLLTFIGNRAVRPGDLEDFLCGSPTLLDMLLGGFLHAWFNSPYYPALTLLVEDGEIVYEIDENDCVWYARPLCLNNKSIAYNRGDN